MAPFPSTPLALSPCSSLASCRPLTRTCVQVREHTSHLEAELEKHMAAASAECQSYAKEVAGVSGHLLTLDLHPSPWACQAEGQIAKSSR